jgi:hypothetical protein
VTQQQTGAGGTEFTFDFIGLRSLAGRADTLRYVSRQVDTEDEVRDGYTRILGLGLVRYLAYASAGDRVDVEFAGESSERQTAPDDDPWNLWVFRASVGAELDGESRRKSRTFEGSFSASRTTEELKVDVSVNGDYERDEFEFRDDSLLVSSARDVGAEATVVWSLGPHWSWGLSASAEAETSTNQALATDLAPAVEYSVYPYAESTRRQITFLYRVGVAHFRYEELTLFDKTRETRPGQSLEISADFVQPWGELTLSLEGSNFLDDFAQHRLDLFTNLEFQLFRGLNLDIRGNVARIKDQIYLSRVGIPDEEVLLERRELGTDYEYSMEVGLSFTFGSVFNNVVNPRIRTGGDFDNF